MAKRCWLYTLKNLDTGKEFGEQVLSSIEGNHGDVHDSIEGCVFSAEFYHPGFKESETRLVNGLFDLADMFSANGIRTCVVCNHELITREEYNEDF